MGERILPLDVPRGQRAQAREALGEVEAALDRIGWRWSLTLSLWSDALLVLSEEAGA
jgi:hypothetical protein